MGGVGRGRVEKGEVGRGRASRVGRGKEIRLRRLKSKTDATSGHLFLLYNPNSS